MRVLPVGLLLVLAAAGAGCGAFGGGDEAPTVKRQQLAVMVLAKQALGPGYRGLDVDSESGPKTATDFADASIDPDDTAGSVKSSGYRGGYELFYSDPRLEALHRGRGLYGIETSVALFESDSAARAQVLKYVRDFQRFEGRRVEGVKVERSSRFDADVGSDAWGLEYTLAAGGFRAHATEIVFHHGRIVGGVSLLRADRSAVRAEALRVAGLLDGRIAGVLAGDVNGEPVSLESARPHVSEARIARMTLAKADLPAGAKLEHEKLEKSDDDHVTYSRSFDLAGVGLGDSNVLSVTAETEVYADSRNVVLIRQIFEGKGGLATFEAAIRSSIEEDGVRLRELSARPLPLGDRRMLGFMLSFRGPRGSFEMAVVMVDRGRALARLIVLAPAGGIEPQDVRALAARARAKLG